MITNEREYRITRNQASRLEDALIKTSASPVPASVDPIIHEAAARALREQLDELREELSAYEGLRGGIHTTLDVETFEDLPFALIRARIASGMTQRELGDKIGIKEQQVQRYEATQYRAASFARLLEVARALGVTVRPSIEFKTNAWTRLINRMKPYGFTSSFVRSRLLDESLSDEELDSPKVLRSAWEAVARVFDSSLETVMGEGPLVLPGALGTVRLKASQAAAPTSTLAYCAYVRRLAIGAVKASKHLVPRVIPTDPLELRQTLLARHQDVNLSAALHFAWASGVVVVPLSDPGSLHGALWRFDGRNVVFLKQRTSSAARWLADLLHELYHAAQEPDAMERTVLDLSDFFRSSDPEEAAAATFASDVILAKQAESLFREIAQRSKGQLERFKKLVPHVAEEAGVPADALANYIAWRLERNGEQSHNWWGTATNLQCDNATTIELARDLCFNNLQAVDDPDVATLFRALRSE
jgi:transcriptional regulator with XRE-family HTH domain